MKRYLSWLCSFWPSKKKYEEIDKLILESNKVTQKADAALSKMIAALDGENRWFECHFIEDKEVENGSNNFNHHTP